MPKLSVRSSVVIDAGYGAATRSEMKRSVGRQGVEIVRIHQCGMDGSTKHLFPLYSTSGARYRIKEQGEKCFFVVVLFLDF